MSLKRLAENELVAFKLLFLKNKLDLDWFLFLCNQEKFMVLERERTKTGFFITTKKNLNFIQLENYIEYNFQYFLDGKTYIGSFMLWVNETTLDFECVFFNDFMPDKFIFENFSEIE